MFLRDGDADVHGLDGGCRRFFGVNGGMEFGGQPAKNIEPYSDDVSGLLEAEGHLGEKLALCRSRLAPAITEPVLVIVPP